MSDYNLSVIAYVLLHIQKFSKIPLTNVINWNGVDVDI